MPKSLFFTIVSLFSIAFHCNGQLNFCFDDGDGSQVLNYIFLRIMIAKDGEEKTFKYLKDVGVGHAYFHGDTIGNCTIDYTHEGPLKPFAKYIQDKSIAVPAMVGTGIIRYFTAPGTLSDYSKYEYSRWPYRRIFTIKFIFKPFNWEKSRLDEVGNFDDKMRLIDFSMIMSEYSKKYLIKETGEIPTFECSARNYNRALLFKYLTYTVGQYETSKLLDTEHDYMILTEADGRPVKLLSVSPESSETRKLRSLFDRMFILNTQAFDISDSSPADSKTGQRLVSVRLPDIFLKDFKIPTKRFPPYLWKHLYVWAQAEQILSERFIREYKSKVSREQLHPAESK